MRLFLFCGSLFAFLVALMHMLVAKSAIHEIAGYVLFLTSAVLMSGAGIIEAVNRLRAVVAREPEAAPKSDPHRYPPG